MKINFCQKLDTILILFILFLFLESKYALSL